MFRLPGSSPAARSPSSAKRTQQKKGRKGVEVEESSTSTVARDKIKRKGDFADLPDKLKKLRACMLCSLIKTELQFEEDGCDNCEAFLQLAGTKGSVTSYTSGNFEGVIGVMKMEDSWVAKWQRIATLKPGLYAVNVRGEVEKWVRREMADAGLPYYCRDKSMLNSSKSEDRQKKRRNRRASPELEILEDEDNDGETNANTAVEIDANEVEEYDNENEAEENDHENETERVGTLQASS